MKDYFSILQISPSAAPTEIKRAYRKLAQEYHPDKHHQDPEKTEVYEQIREAYLILTDPGKRTKYLEERWLLKSKGIQTETELITAPLLLKKAIELNRQISHLDPYRFNSDWILNQFKQLLNPENVEILTKTKDRVIVFTFFSMLLDSIEKLPHDLCESIAPAFHSIQKEDPSIRKRLQRLLIKKKRLSQWKKIKPWLILLITILLCLLIGLAG